MLFSPSQCLIYTALNQEYIIEKSWLEEIYAYLTRAVVITIPFPVRIFGVCNIMTSIHHTCVTLLIRIKKIKFKETSWQLTDFWGITMVIKKMLLWKSHKRNCGVYELVGTLMFLIIRGQSVEQRQQRSRRSRTLLGSTTQIYMYCKVYNGNWKDELCLWTVLDP